ncbi:MAG: hypothetical protein ACI4EV_08480 [Lachnospiraceae bacterium]
MERLVVYETDNGHFSVRPVDWCGIWNAEGKIKECGIRHTAIFENKEDAEWFANSKNAEEQGLLLRLPCNVGDTIYIVPDITTYRLNKLHGHPEHNMIHERTVHSVQIFSNGRYVILTGEGWSRVTSDFYKETWFLTLEEAEQKLKEMEGD